MRLTTGVPNDDLNRVADSIRQSEALGYDLATTQENRHDPFLPLAVAAVASERIELATSISIAFARSPMVFANLGWDLQKSSGGRFVLGLGSQVKGHNERRFSVPWSAPAPRLKECVQAIRTIWDCWKQGGKLDFQGEHYRFSLMTPNFTPEPMTPPPPPITIAAVGPAMMRVAGEVCDGAVCTVSARAGISRKWRFPGSSRRWLHPAGTAVASKSPAAVSLPPVRRTKRWPGLSNGCACGSDSMVRPGPTGPCSKCTDWKSSVKS